MVRLFIRPKRKNGGDDDSSSDSSSSSDDNSSIDDENQPTLRTLIETVQAQKQTLPPRGTTFPDIPGLRGSLKPYQKEGIQWIVDHVGTARLGVVLADEMGLGKTVQSIAAMLEMVNHNLLAPPFLVVCPLSVVHSWEREFAQFTLQGTFRVMKLFGAREERDQLIESTEAHILASGRNNRPPFQHVPFDVLITTPETLLADMFFASRINFSLLVFDEAHRLKNKRTKLFRSMQKQLPHVSRRLLLTGTPVHNHPDELFALLRFANPALLTGADRIEVGTDAATISQLHEMTDLLILRRMKAEVLKDLPPIKEYLAQLPLSPLQRDLYRSILRKDITSIAAAQKCSLLNTVMQLRKCCNHPYMFPGVEKEPFVMGEHLILNSSKMVFLDKLLFQLKEGSHRVLLFSQFSFMLDILQDYLAFRNFSCVRLDGSVRGDERSAVVDSFQDAHQDVFVFLLSTRAGGVGLTLTAADTVIFYDSDWNPQMDLQAQQRAHRIGQQRPVVVYRLLCQQSVEDGMMMHAARKLAMTANLLQKATQENSEEAVDHKWLVQWGAAGRLDAVTDDDKADWASYVAGLDVGAVLNGSGTPGVSVCTTLEAINASIQKGNEAIKKIQQEILSEPRAKRGEDRATTMFGDISPRSPAIDDIKTREKLTERERLEKLVKTVWSKSGYVSHALPLDDWFYSDMPQDGALPTSIQRLRECQQAMLKVMSKLDRTGVEIESEEEEEEQSSHIVHHVVGSVTQPIAARAGVVEAQLIIVPVNNSGEWSNFGGLFKSVQLIVNGNAAKLYAAAKENADLRLGDVHLLPTKLSPTVFVALAVVQKSSTRSRQCGGDVDLKALDTALSRAAQFAGHLTNTKNADVVSSNGMKCSLHFPHLPASSPTDSYAMDKIIQKHLARFGCYLYYFKRQHHQPASPVNQPDRKRGRGDDAPHAHASLPSPQSPAQQLADTADGVPHIHGGTFCLVGFSLDDPVDTQLKKKVMRCVLLHGGVMATFEEVVELSRVANGAEKCTVVIPDGMAEDQCGIPKELHNMVKVVAHTWVLQQQQ